MPTADQLAVIRSWCGSDVGANGDRFDAIDVDARLARLGSANAVALEILRQRRADFAVNPAEENVDGDFAAKTVENIKALERDIGRLETIVAAESGAGTSSTSLMVRRSDRASRCR